MDPGRWADGNAKALTVVLHGGALRDNAHDGRCAHDDTFALLINAWREPLPFTTPPAPEGAWTCEIDTSGMAHEPMPGGSSLELIAHSLMLLRRPEPKPAA